MRSRALRSMFFAAVVAMPSPLRAQDLSTEAWQEDLDYLVETIVDVHPRPFHRIGESEFREAASLLSARLHEMSDPESAVALMRLVARIGDGHTSLRPRGRILGLDRWFPLHFERFVDGLFIVGAGAGYENLLGARVLEIQRVQADEVWRRVLDISFGDNEFGRMAGAPFYLSMPSVLGALGLGNGETLQLDVMLRSGERRTTSVAAVSGEPDFGRFFADWWPPVGEGATLPVEPSRTRAGMFRNRGLDYWAETDAAAGRLYARIAAIGNARGNVLVDGESVELTLAEFSDRIFAIVDAGEAQTLVIDLRGNAGGNNRLAVPLVEGVVARPQLNARGRLFVLVDRYTFSAAMNLVSMLEDRTEAIFIGEPPGGSPLHFGDNTGFSLPNSGLGLNVSTLEWDTGVAPTDVRQQMEPDIWAPLSSEDAIEGRDPGLVAIDGFTPDSRLSDRLWRLYEEAGIEEALAATPTPWPLPDIPAPWGSQVQQLIEFATRVIESGAGAADIYRAFEAVAERYPESPVAWFELGRVYAFGRRWEDATAAFERASRLRPSDSLVRRFWEAARRRLPR